MGLQLSKEIKEQTNMSIQQFCRDVLKINEKSFYYRLRVGMIRLDELFKILDYGISIELFREFIKEKHRQAASKEKKRPAPNNTKEQEEVFIDVF